MRRWPLRSTTSAVLIALLMSVGLAACGDDGSDAAPSDDGSDPVADPADDATQTPPDASANGGSGSGTLTMADGTVYELELATCETSDNAEGFVVPNSYDVFGKTADGAFTASFNRAGLDADFISEIVTLEGDFDENGQNPGILYQDVADTIALTVDGDDVTGTVTLETVGGLPGPHGDQIDATVDISC